MAHDLHVIVQPPSSPGGRVVRVDSTTLGTTYGQSDLREFLRRAGVEDWAGLDLAASPLLVWRGGGPDVW